MYYIMFNYIILYLLAFLLFQSHGAFFDYLAVFEIFADLHLYFSSFPAEVCM